MSNKVQDDETKSFDHDLAGKYLSFALKQETYGCPISPINDIIEMKDITQVPQTRDYVDGVINLRGSVIPVINTREKFGMEREEYDRETVIIVVELDDLQTGLIVDRVREVIDVTDDQVDPAPGMGDEIDAKFIAGMGKIDEEVVILLNLENILGEQEVEELKQMKETGENS